MQSPLVVACYSNYSIHGGQPRHVDMSIEFSDLLVMTELSVLSAASPGLLFKSTADDRILNHNSVFVPHSVVFLDQFNADIFMPIINESNFDLVLTLISFTHVTEIYRAPINMEDTWISYDWEIGDLLAFPAVPGAIIGEAWGRRNVS